MSELFPSIEMEIQTDTHIYVYVYITFFSWFCCCLSPQSCPTLFHLMDHNLPGSSVQGNSQIRILEWIAISFFWGSSWPRDQTCFSCLAVDSLLLSQLGSHYLSIYLCLSIHVILCVCVCIYIYIYIYTHIYIIFLLFY